MSEKEMRKTLKTIRAENGIIHAVCIDFPRASYIMEP